MDNIRKNTSSLKVGVIGVGNMGQRHCRVYANLPGVQLVGVADARAEHARQIAQQYGITYFEDVNDLLNIVDAVSLVTPTPAHFQLAHRCIQQGIHVLVEKPFTRTLEEAEILVQLTESKGTIVQVGHIERFNPAYTELKHVVENLDLVALNLRRLSAYEVSNTDVDVVMDLMIHDIDLVLDLMGEQPSKVDAYGMSIYSDSIDYATAQLCFPSGQLVTLNASRVTEQKVRSIEVTALEAYVESNLLNKSIAVHRRSNAEYLSQSKGVKYRQESIVEVIHVPAFEPLLLELEHFISCIKEQKTPCVSAKDGYNALRLASAIQTAIHNYIGSNKQPALCLANMPVLAVN